MSFAQFQRAIWLGLLLVAAACSPSTTAPPASALNHEKEPCLNGSTELDCKANAVIRQIDSNKDYPSSGTIDVQTGDMKAGATVKIDFAVLNTISVATASAFRINSLSLTAESDPGFQCFDGTGTIRCSDMDGKWKRVVPAGAQANGTVDKETFRIQYTQKIADDKTIHNAKLCIDATGDPAFPYAPPVCIKFGTISGKPKILVPAEVKFGYVKAGKTSDPQVLQITNKGSAPLTISKMFLEGDKGFGVLLPKETAQHFGGSIQAFTVADLTIATGEHVDVMVTFAAIDEVKRTGVLHIFSNDLSVATSTDVKLEANSEVPCIKVLPPIVDFGAALIGNQVDRKITLQNCGSLTLSISNIAFKPGGSNLFALSFPNDTTPTVAKPVVLLQNKSLEFMGHYTPDQVSPLDPSTKNPTPDMADLIVTSNSEDKNVHLQGVCVKAICPEAKIVIKEGEEVVPQTNLHLSGEQSKGKGTASIAKYQWSIKNKPIGAAGLKFLPNDFSPAPNLLLNAAGPYTICLNVTDSTGLESNSCQETCSDVIVVPSDCLHVELLWHTPGDKDETDDFGADLDLHVAHSLAGGADTDCDGKPDPWFDASFDCFWFDGKPQWGSAAASVKDDPDLALDDTDGAGPENINLPQPQGTQVEPTQYPVGVHYWNDKGLGHSFATLRVYICGVLAVDYSQPTPEAAPGGGIELKALDMWYVGKINWPNKVAGGGTQEVLDTCYQTGNQCLFKKDPSNPKAGQMWQPKPKNNWCITPCYVSPNAPTGGAVKCGN